MNTSGGPAAVTRAGKNYWARPTLVHNADRAFAELDQKRWYPSASPSRSHCAIVMPLQAEGTLNAGSARLPHHCLLTDRACTARPFGSHRNVAKRPACKHRSCVRAQDREPPWTAIFDLRERETDWTEGNQVRTYDQTLDLFLVQSVKLCKTCCFTPAKHTSACVGPLSEPVCKL